MCDCRRSQKMNQEKSKKDEPEKVRREEPEKEPSRPKPKIDSEEDILEKIVKGMGYRYEKHQFYKQPFAKL